jgi:hypothetical protein
MEMGKQGFVWWFGIIEDIYDNDLQLGRVKVRVHHFHNPSKSVLPTEDLPWAHVIMPTTSASTTGIGWSPTFLQVDTTVFGFFADGERGQMPVVLGTLPGIPQPNPEFPDINSFSVASHDVSDIARGTNRISSAKAALQDPEYEPSPNNTYAARYPFNKVFETGFPGRQGHVMEFDDTPGRERIHMYHSGGSYTEMSPGLKVDKTNGTHFDISSVGKVVKTSGDLIVIADGATTIYSQGSLTMASDGIVNISGKLINMTSQLGTVINAGGALAMSSVLATSVSAGGLVDVTAGAAVSVKATGAVNITGGAAVSIKGASISLVSAGALDIIGTGALGIGGPSAVVGLTGSAVTATATGAMTLTGTGGLFLNPI